MPAKMELPLTEGGEQALFALGDMDGQRDLLEQIEVSLRDAPGKLRRSLALRRAVADRTDVGTASILDKVLLMDSQDHCGGQPAID